MSSSSGELTLKGIVQEILTYKTGIAGTLIILFLVALSIYTIIAIPVNRAIYEWRSTTYWLDVPREAAPVWVKYITGKNLPETIIVDSRKGGLNVLKTSYVIAGTNIKRMHIELSFYYDYDGFPSEVNLFYYANLTKPIMVNVYWVKPDGNKILLTTSTVSEPNQIFYISENGGVENTITSFVNKVTGGEKAYVSPRIALFAKDDKSLRDVKTAQVLKSSYFTPPRKYKVIIDATAYGASSKLDAKLVVYGVVYGLAGTDYLRRDLMLAILWGTPVALAFGLLASLSITIAHLVIATISGYYGGRVDSIIQRLTEVYMIIPFLPFLIIIQAFYRLTIWVLVLIIFALSIFSPGIKSTRALVMEIKSYPYVEAARAYGASNWRIILYYIIPKILPPIIPGLITAIPGFVFLEAGLSFLGLGDPYLPTWGKVINDAYTNGCLYKGLWWWILLPSGMLMLTAIAFALLGFALDKIVNPKLREW